MEKYMLDTNSWIEYFKNRNGVADHVDALPRTQLCASEITVAELIYGAYNSKNFEKHYREAMWLKNNIEIYPISLGKLCSLPCETHESPKGDYAVSLGKRTQIPRCRVSGVAVFRPSCRQQTVISPAFRHIFRQALSIRLPT